MKKLYIAATALFLASSAAAHAGNVISFEIKGQKIDIQAPRNCSSLNCITILAPGLTSKPIRLKNLNLNGFGSKDDDEEVASNPAAPAQPAPSAPTAQQASPQPVSQSAAQPAPAVSSTSAPATTVATASPAAVGFDATTAPVVAPAPVATAPAPAPVAAAPAPITPIGLWAAEKNKGNVRVEQCGANLCGYAEKTGAKILINMKPEGSKWAGRIHDPDSGRNYDSTIAMKGPNGLRVQGCAFGGLFCGGQTWKRVS